MRLMSAVRSPGVNAGSTEYVDVPWRGAALDYAMRHGWLRRNVDADYRVSDSPKPTAHQLNISGVYCVG